MNFLTLLLFFIYCGAIFILGAAIYSCINSQNQNHINRYVLAGEILLLGSIILIGEMLVLSFCYLYSALFLWSAVILNYGFLLNKSVRKIIYQGFGKPCQFDLLSITFVGLLLIFFFRNLYYLSDGDSHSTYLFAQKIWLSAQTSLVGSPGMDMRLFVPHFNAIPYALGLSLFGNNTFFPQLIVAFWTVISLLLLYGYLGFRFNRYLALAGVMLVLFDEHMFFSGANSCCITNSALIALLFATSYNFWEARASQNGFRFVLALIFLSQLMANKYQMFYVTIFLLVIGVLIQSNPFKSIVEIFKRRNYILPLLAAVIILLLWYVKNWIITGIPVFPILAGKLGVWNWTSEMTDVINHAYVAGLSLTKFVKYMSFLFIWQGITVLKIVILGILVTPFILLFSFLRAKPNEKVLSEVFYWMVISVLIVAGICLVSFLDPRHYRYGIAVFAFAAIAFISMAVRHFFGDKFQKLLGMALILFALTDANIIFAHGGQLLRPSFADNWNTVVGKLTAKDAMARYYPKTPQILDLIAKEPQKFSQSAWDTGMASNAYVLCSPFLLPLRPQIGILSTTIVKWDSYSETKLVKNDLEEAGIKWVISISGEEPKFLTLDEYSQQAVGYNRNLTELMYNYGFPSELTEVK